MEGQWAWAQEILDKLHLDFKNNGELSYTVFYSSLKLSPDLLIIGDNPGGTEKDDKQTELHPEGYHEYYKYDYPLAQKMKDLILAGEDLQTLLKDSVKINRIFFKSRNLKELFKNRELLPPQEYCRPFVESIIQYLRPKILFAESFGAFEYLCGNKHEILIRKEGTDKALLLKGVYYKDKSLKVLGINHPSRASYHRITNADWGKVNDMLRDLLIKNSINNM